MRREYERGDREKEGEYEKERTETEGERLRQRRTNRWRVGKREGIETKG